MAKVSVIVPCYNQAQYIDDAIQSVLAQTYRDFEIIIVNDGSTDPETYSVLETYKSPLIKVIHTDNQGIANARNRGIRESSGVYILPLDADDKIADSYMAKAVEILDALPNTGILYCLGEFFGEKTGGWDLPEYSFPEILLENMIFCSAFYRKSDWQAVNGYNPNMKYGWADYDLWLSIIGLGRAVFRINECLFSYRQRSGSMNQSLTQEHLIYLHTQLFKNHSKLYTENMSILFQHILELREEVSHLASQVPGMERRLKRV